ncbi:hypothetical protein [Sphingomonas sp.]|nr:hypothetical protein [Sphingomonas sp.]
MHRCHDPIELLFAIAVPVHEPGKIALGKRGLLLRDRVQRDFVAI